ncbi:YbdD/YjiX family protein [Agrococcus beijingensis]|uniref:YbdD/YjiX family protein n=1 Tax=Agrococcus beijingensis TaxID=3068634 RepID=UPI002742892C|nr:YbdD/YjiX family protein [Agrococcus sp. REN33]
MTAPRAHQEGPASAGALLWRAWDGLVWWAKGVTGESKYQAYLDHEGRVHPDRPVMTEREFWRDEYRRQDANPEGRCC